MLFLLIYMRYHDVLKNKCVWYERYQTHIVATVCISDQTHEQAWPVDHVIPAEKYSWKMEEMPVV
jgi:hypothetical protein